MNGSPEVVEALRALIQSAPTGELPGIRGALAALEAELLARLVTPRLPDDPAVHEKNDDRCISLGKTAAIIGKAPRWLRDHKELHQQLGRVDMGGRNIMFSEKRVLSFIKRKSYG